MHIDKFLEVSDAQAVTTSSSSDMPRLERTCLVSKIGRAHV